ncbi:MAG: phosphate acyltransferase PlsX, partial [Candidatus Bipolaricaulota bacterium]
MRIVLDVMGGDRPPIDLIQGGVHAARRHDLEILFVGDPEVIGSALATFDARDSSRFTILAADQVITMDERPVQAVRAKRGSSMIVGLEALRDGRADAFVSPGNTGAIVAGSLFTLGRLRAIPRPGLAAILPSLVEREFTLIDVGATVDCTPEHLLHFALMGATHARAVLGVQDPTVAVLSIGEERGKGNRLVARATTLLDDAPFRFVGNVEGHQLLLERPADVVVTDGFTGNVLVKGIEGGVHATTALLRASISERLRHKLGALLLRTAFS